MFWASNRLAPKQSVSISESNRRDNCARFWRIDEEPDEQPRAAAVTIIGSGALSHWATVWDFAGGVVRVAELTAWPVADGGAPFEECNYLYYEIASLESLVRETGYTRLETPCIRVTTSPAELLSKCREHGQNGTPYHVANNNCQRWIVALLCQGYGVSPDLLPPTWADSAVALPEQFSKAALAGSASGVLGRVGGGLGMVLSIVDMKLAVDDLKGRPPTQLCDLVAERLRRLTDLYRQEPPSPARDEVVKALRDQSRKLDTVREQIASHHTGFNVGRIGSNMLGIASGACFLAAPLTFGAASVLGAGLAFASTATFGSCQVADSFRSSQLRTFVLEVADGAVEAQRSYVASTGRLGDGLGGSPGIFEFSVPGARWCQFYMTVMYTSHDGTTMQRVSCDKSSYSWHSDHIVIEPGARNVQVSFDVRGGRQVFAVDRSKKKLPWIKPFRKEVFHYECGDGVRAHFHLAGTSMHAYVCGLLESRQHQVER